MAFGDNTAARARKAELIKEQADTMVTIQSSKGTIYRVYKDLPPGTGWVLKKVGVICPKWYLTTREEALGAADRHEAVHSEGGHKAKQAVEA